MTCAHPMKSAYHPEEACAQCLRDRIEALEGELERTKAVMESFRNVNALPVPECDKCATLEKRILVLDRAADWITSP